MFQNMYPWWIPGAALTLFGLLIAVFPELLSLMVASAFLFIGIGWLVAGWKFRQMQRDNQNGTTVYTYQRW